MTGKHSDLITRSFRHIENVSLRQALESLLEVILFHQYVSSPLLPNELKVISGSGMGNRHSGEVSDVAYLDGVEKHTALREESRERFGILLYGRFRDDVICIQNADCAHAFPFFAWHATQSGYELEMEQDLEGEGEITTLDLTLMIEKDFIATRSIEWKPQTKSTSQKLPLSYQSAHTSRVHQSWPIGETIRLFNRCSQQKYFDEARRNFVQRLQENDFPSPLIKEILGLVPGMRKHQREKSDDADNRLFWVIPHHPDMEKNRMAKIANDLLDAWYPSEPHPRVIISWKSQYINLSETIRKLSSRPASYHDQEL